MTGERNRSSRQALLGTNKVCEQTVIAALGTKRRVLGATFKWFVVLHHGVMRLVQHVDVCIGAYTRRLSTPHFAATTARRRRF